MWRRFFSTTAAQRVVRKPNRSPPLSLIMLQDVPGVGSAGARVAVTRGHGRNHLVPKGLAVHATHENMQKYHNPAADNVHVASLSRDEELIRRRLQSKAIELVRNTDRSFEVTPEDIAVRFRKMFNLDVPLERIEIPQPITVVGPHSARVHLNSASEGEATADDVLELRVDVIPQSGLRQRVADLERRKEKEAERREAEAVAGAAVEASTDLAAASSTSQ